MYFKQSNNSLRSYDFNKFSQCTTKINSSIKVFRNVRDWHYNIKVSLLTQPEYKKEKDIFSSTHL